MRPKPNARFENAQVQVVPARVRAVRAVRAVRQKGADISPWAAIHREERRPAGVPPSPARGMARLI